MSSFLLTLALAVQTASAPAPAAAPVPGVWTFRESTDPAKPKSATASVSAADGSRLLLRCDTVNVPIVSVQFMPKPAVPAGDSRMVTLTLDEGMADVSSWLFPGKGAYNGEPPEVFPIAEEIARAKKVRIGFFEGDKSIEQEFAGPGGDAIFRKVYAACGLPYAMPSVTPAPTKQ
ncbi:hypothetical protein MZO42_05290 [Sphingomonas psychrotolerans]|uniref:Invasion associated locus B family protein n=1 Tax=Sphingomonas psychrotolerans TaxID=1327635 RepID=A0ABU3N473_9SPHN|nr:hypothetical protein [Sphingomonas psychrotolerans]MDT8758105.1 hypothetical protein [Sphingomonas psychrotolerans]